MRISSPYCEGHRSLARRAALEHGLDVQTQIFGLVARNRGDVVASADIDSVAAALRGDGGKETSAVGDGKENVLPLLPKEIPYPRGDGKDVVARVIVYGHVGSSAWNQWHGILKEMEGVEYVFRHMGAIDYEEFVAATDRKEAYPSTSLSNLATRTYLQGYGVRLDIKNVEYKTINEDDDNEQQQDTDADADGAAQKSNEETNPDETEKFQSEDDEKEKLEEESSTFVSGIDLQLLSQRVKQKSESPRLPAGLNNVKRHLALLAEEGDGTDDDGRLPPLWKLRSLGLQLCMTMGSSSDPLVTLRDLTWDLPTYARALSDVYVSEKTTKAWQHNIQAYRSRKTDRIDGRNLLVVNGRARSFEYASFDAFSVLQMIRNETAKEDHIIRSLPPGVQMDKIKKILLEGDKKMLQMGNELMGKKEDTEKDDQDYQDDKDDKKDDDSFSGGEDAPIRIDVGRGGKGAIHYIVDIEKDPQFSQWPTNVEMLLYPQGPPRIRRNLFNMLIAVDPFKNDVDNHLQLVYSLLTSGYPVRLGIVMASAADLEAYVAEGGGDAFLKRDEKTTATFDRPATAMDLFAMFMHINQHKGAGRAFAFSFLMNVFRSFDFDLEHPTMEQFVELYSKLMEHAGVSIADSEENIRKILQKGTYHGDYLKGVKFHAAKRLPTGSAYMNGVPLPNGEDEVYEEKTVQIIQEEQVRMVKMVKQGRITRETPKSIYSETLKGKRVYKKFYPGMNERIDQRKYVPILGTEHDGRWGLIQGKGGKDKNQDDEKDKGTKVPQWNKKRTTVVVTGSFDFDSEAGLNATDAVLLALCSTLQEDGDEDIYYLLQGSVKNRRSSKTSKIFERVLQSSLPPYTKLTALRALRASSTKVDSAQTFVEVLQSLIVLGSEDKLTMINAVKDKKDVPLPSLISGDALPDSFITINGRLFDVSSGLDLEDFVIMYDLEVPYAYAISDLLPSPVANTDKNLDHVRAIVRATTLINTQLISSAGLVDMDADLSQLELDQNLYFSWNQMASGPKVTVTLDPFSHTAQRLASLLVIFRDVLRLPLKLLMVPTSIAGKDVPTVLKSYYRFVAALGSALPGGPNEARFTSLARVHTLTMQPDVPEQWNVQQSATISDTDNLICGEGTMSGCGDVSPITGIKTNVTTVEYALKNLIVMGQCFEATGSGKAVPIGRTGSPPNGLQLTLTEAAAPGGTVTTSTCKPRNSGTLVMKNLGYWQLRADPGMWNLEIAEGSRGSELFHITNVSNDLIELVPVLNQQVAVLDFEHTVEIVTVQRKVGTENVPLLLSDDDDVNNTLTKANGEEKGKGGGLASWLPAWATGGSKEVDAAIKKEDDTIHVFSLATGHLYERFLRIMMLSVFKRTSSRVKFWLFENYLSPTFKDSANRMAADLGFEVQFVTYKWPEWLQNQTEKQRIIWGYKILFLDVLFPLDLKKIIYVDADQVVRGDLQELWDFDLEGAPYGYVPFCGSREETLGYQFWRQGFWKNHLGSMPYHISALYVVDLRVFRAKAVGDALRSTYEMLSKDKNSLANLDQDLPNYAQHRVRIKSLPQEWLWCESWCSDESKAESKTIDLCNNPMHKEPKLDMAKRVISGELFEESWIELDEEARTYVT